MKNSEIAARRPSPPDERTIFGEVLDWMLAPLLFLWPLSIAATYYFSQDVANLPYDAALQNRLTNVAAQTQAGIALPEDGLLPKTDAGSGKTWYRIVDADGTHRAGAIRLPVPPATQWRTWQTGQVVFRESDFAGQELRVALMVLAPAAGDRVLVVVGETQEARALLANRIVAGVIVPQFFLIPLALALLGFGLRQGLAPLRHLREALSGRDAGDFSPIPVRRVPEEIEPLVDSFNSMLRRMKRNADAQRRFIADAAHQIRTPLTGIKTQAQLALRETDPQALQHALDQIANSVDRATRLAHQLLTLARTESGEIGLQQLEPIDLDRLVRERIGEWIPRAFEKDIDLGYDPRGAAWIEGNPFLLGELINNLIDNALRYTPRNGTVTGRTLKNGEFIVLEIEDNGVGITLEQAELVFERFYRVDDAHSPGSGLGLAIVREIATLHGAYAALRPNPKGRGAVARVVFPAREPRSTSVEDAETESELSAEQGA